MQSTLPVRISSMDSLKGFSQTLAGKASLAIAATGFVAICAHVSVPLYFTPVPITLQTLAVILVGLALGPALGCSAMLLYLAEGAVGLPVFSPIGMGGMAQLLGPTGGYLLAYPLAAAAAGALVRRVSFGRSQFASAVFGATVASVLILLSGAGWLAHLPGVGASAAWHLGIEPFLPGEMLKVAAAGWIYASFSRWKRN